MTPEVAWLAAGALTAAADGAMVRRYDGRLGAQARAECRAAVARAGGPRRAAAAWCSATS